MSIGPGFRLGPACALVLTTLALCSCAADGPATPSSEEPELAIGDFTNKKFQVTKGNVCGSVGGVLPTKQFAQSLDEDVNGVDVTGFIPVAAHWELFSGDLLVNAGSFQRICSGVPDYTNLYNLPSALAGATDLSAGDLALGTYTLRVVFSDKVLARARFEVVP